MSARRACAEVMLRIAREHSQPMSHCRAYTLQPLSAALPRELRQRPSRIHRRRNRRRRPEILIHEVREQREEMRARVAARYRVRARRIEHQLKLLVRRLELVDQLNRVLGMHVVVAGAMYEQIARGESCLLYTSDAA